LTVDQPGGHGKGRSPESASRRTDHSSVSLPGYRRRRIETGHAPILLRYWDRTGDDGPFGGYDQLSSFVLELPLSELARFLPQQFAVRLFNLVRKLFSVRERPCFPCTIGEFLRNGSLLDELRQRLMSVNHLSELIADPPAIVIDQRQKLFFYRGVPVPLRPVSFSYMLLLAQSPGELVLREVIYRCLWPGEINFEGTNKPYERQITDQKRKLLDDIRRGIAGRLEIREGELESLIATRHKMGYMLNLERKEVLVLRKGNLLVIAFLLFLEFDRFFPDWVLDFQEASFLW
jgi:DNA-binding winged helix-turn-helix (wHTH) protein